MKDNYSFSRILSKVTGKLIPKAFTVVLFLITGLIAQAQQLGIYNFNIANNCPTGSVTTSVPAALGTFSPFSSSGVTCVTLANEYAANNGWPITTPTAATTQYFEFTFTPGAGKIATFSKLKFKIRRSGASPTVTCYVRSNVDGYATNVAGPFTALNQAAPGAAIAPITLGSTFANRTVATTFRIYGVLSAASTTMQFIIDDVELLGVVTPISIPGSTITICQGTTFVTMAANAVSGANSFPNPGGTGTWAQTAGPAGPIITSPNSPTTTITNITTVGSYSFRWRITHANDTAANHLSNGFVTVQLQSMQTYTPQLAAFVNHGATGYYVTPSDPPNITICFRDMIDFDNTWSLGMPAGGAMDFWVNNSWAQATPPVVYSNNTLNDQDSVYLKFTYSGTGCYNSPTYSNKFYFTVYPSDPPDAVSATVSPGPYCAGQNITFNATVGGQLGSSPTYKWLDNGVPIPGATALSYTGIFTAGTHPIEFVVGSSDTCSSPTTDTLSLGNIVVGLCYDTMNASGWTTISRCGGVFYDNGGPASFYTNANNTGLLTILPATPGQYVTVTFTSFSSELNIDKLRIFSGTDTSTFLGQLTGTGSACGTFTSAHSSGGLTFKWITNATINAAGWVANLGCSPTPSIVTPGLNCANPIGISTLPYSVAGQTNTCFSNNHVSGMGCATTNVSGNDNFYRYVATGPECITIFLNNASSNAISLNVYEGCPGAGGICRATWTTAVGGNLGGQVTLPNAGTYYFVVDANNAVNFTYNLNINSFGSAPLNDLPCNAEMLIQTVPHFDDNSCAGTESGGGVNNANCISGNINSLWYSFTTNPGQTQARIRFTRGLGTLPDLTTQMYSGSCSALTYMSCANNSMNGFWDCQSQPQLVVGVSASTTYYIRVDGQANATGSYQITVDDPLDPLNVSYGYDCDNPIAVSAPTCTYGTPAFIGVGNKCDFPTSNPAGFVGERDGVYFLFQTIAGTNGANQLTFDIYSDPSVTTDWDFIIWNVTSQYPNNICSYLSSGAWNTASGMISSSWVDTWQAPANGHTGCRSTGTTHINGFPFNAPIPLSGTQWWMLYISNFRFGQFPYGFTLDMSYSNSSTVSSYNPQNAGAVVYNNSQPPQMIWWTGQANTTNWFTIQNWGGCAVPSCTNLTSATIASVYSPGLPFPTIAATGAVTKNLTIRPGGSLTITPAGQLDVCGNYLNIGTFTAQSGSTVRAISDQFQYFDGSMSGSSAFSNLIMTKSLAPLRPVTLFNKAEVTGALTLTAGKIITNAKELYISNTAPTLFNAPNGNTNSYVQGNLRRGISGSGGSYDFPVGIVSSYQRANLNFTTATTIPTILSFFTGTAIPAQPGPIGPECPNYDYSTLAPLNNGYWTMTASANPTSGTYNTTLYNTGYTNSSGGAWTVLKAPVAAGPWTLDGTCAAGSTANATTRNGMSGFSVFTAGQSIIVPVPVELLTLTATLEHVGVAVDWETASEINNHHFDVERSRDGVHFEKIGEKAGAGNSTVNLYYNLIDENPYNGINYYRLKQVDYDGTYEYSDKVFVVVNPDAGIVGVYPNPAQNDLMCDLYADGSGKLRFEIMDVLGKTYSVEIRDVHKGLNQKVEFNIAYLPQGVYFIKVTPADGSNIMPASQMRFVKQMKEE